MTSSAGDGSGPTIAVLVAVVIPALNEEGKIGRVLDKLPLQRTVRGDRRGRRSRTIAPATRPAEHGAAVVIRHERRAGSRVPPSVTVGMRVWRDIVPTWLCSRVMISTSRGSWFAPVERILDRTRADYVQGSRWMRGGEDRGARPAVGARYAPVLVHLQRCWCSVASRTQPMASDSSVLRS